MNFLSRLHSLFLPAIGIFLLTSLFPVVHAQQTVKAEFHTTVKLKVSADKSIEHLITSYIKRELRSLGDVRIVEKYEDAMWQLELLGIEAEIRGGYQTGVVLTVLILRPFHNQPLLRVLPEEYRHRCNIATSGLHYFCNQWLRTGSSEDLRRICEKIVADFDSKYLEESRKMYRIWQKALNKQE